MPYQALSLAPPFAPPACEMPPAGVRSIPENFVPWLSRNFRRDVVSLAAPSFSSSSHAPINRHPQEFDISGDTEEENILRYVAEASESKTTTLPCVRTFENDLARLSLVGSVGFDQAITASAADGGQAAEDHILAGVPCMVIETVFPSPSDPHATVSTRLFLPSEKVRNRAEQLKEHLKEDILSSTSSQNMLAMTFRQVVMRKLWNFELSLFAPGTIRNMNELESQCRKLHEMFLLRSSEEKVIFSLSEVVCVASLRNTERQFSEGMFRLLKSNRIVSSDSSIIIEELPDDDIVEYSKTAMRNLNLNEVNFLESNFIRKRKWWEPPVMSKLQNIVDSKFYPWICEHVPRYRILIDAESGQTIHFDRINKNADNKYEFLLTHSQMVGLAGVLDMLYEDINTLPRKDLLPNGYSITTGNKRRKNSHMNMLSRSILLVVFAICICAMSLLRFPRLRNGVKVFLNKENQTSEVEFTVDETLSIVMVTMRRFRDAIFQRKNDDKAS